MTKRKKLALTALALVLVIGGILGGTAIVAAQDEETPPEEQAQADTILDRAAAIYEEKTGTALDTEALKSAYQEAGKEMLAERHAAILDKLVENGVITQEEADEYQAWLEARPDINLGPGQFNPGKGPFGQRFHGFGGMQDRGWCFQDDEVASVQ